VGWPLVGLITENIKILVAQALIGQPRVVVCANDPAGSGALQTDIPAAIDDFSE
jgi:hypothetical protein